MYCVISNLDSVICQQIHSTAICNICFTLMMCHIHKLYIYDKVGNRCLT